MSRRLITTWFLFSVIILALSACGRNETTASPDAFYTQAAETMIAAQALTAQAPTTTASVQPTQEDSATQEATNTPLITNTYTPGGATNTPLSFITPQATQNTGCNNYRFIDDIGLQDGDEIEPGASFIKTWRVENLGPCSWDEDYSLIFGWGGEGTNWSSVDRVYLPEEVLSGETIDISVTLTAPNTAGNYGAYFVLRSDSDITFGSTLTVLITVK